MPATIVAEAFDGDDSSPQITFRLRGAAPGTPIDQRLEVSINVNVKTASGQRIDSEGLTTLLANVPGLTAQQKTDLKTLLQAVYAQAQAYVLAQVED